MIISDSLTYGEVFGALERGHALRGSEGQPYGVYRGRVFKARSDRKRVRDAGARAAKLWVIGSEHDLPVAA
jgi:hypothetical protein